MLWQFPNARVAVTHDDDWCALIEEVCMSDRDGYRFAYLSPKADERFPDDDELLRRLRQKYNPILKSGGMHHHLIDTAGPHIFSGLARLIPHETPDVGAQYTSLKFTPLTTGL